MSVEEFGRARRLADARGKYWEDRGRAAQNWSPNQLSGALGEVAAAGWLRGRGLRVDDAFEDLERQAEADIIVPGLRIDVKTSRDDQSHHVPEEQVPRLKEKADVILWCVETHDQNGWDDDATSCRVTLVGWSTPADLAAEPETAAGGEYQVRRALIVRDLRELLARAV